MQTEYQWKYWRMTTALIFVKLKYLMGGREKFFHSLSVHTGCTVKLTCIPSTPRAPSTQAQRPDREANGPNFSRAQFLFQVLYTFSRGDI
jgi:hypothetical protein